MKDKLDHFENIIKEQLARIEQIKQSPDWVDYSAKEKIVT